MMDMLREWLVRLIGAAFLMTMASVLTPKGAVKRIELLCCAVILLLAALEPVWGGMPDIPELASLQEEIRRQTEEFRENGYREREVLIEEELVSYIETKAAELQFDCAVTVRVKTDGRGIPYPEEVEIRSAEKNGALSQYLRELGIAEKRIRWRIT